MVNIVFYFSLLLGFISSQWGQNDLMTKAIIPTTEEKELFRLINEYRHNPQSSGGTTFSGLE